MFGGVPPWRDQRNEGGLALGMESHLPSREVVAYLGVGREKKGDRTGLVGTRGHKKH